MSEGTTTEPAETVEIPAGLRGRTIASLASAVMPAGAAMSGAFASTAVLAEEITGSELLAGIAAAGVTAGSTIASVPLANYMSNHGRRPGLRIAYTVGILGALSSLGAALLSFYPLLVLGSIGIGAGNAGNLAARFAAADLATDENRASSISWLVWMGMFGSVLGPIVALGLATDFAVGIGIEELAGPYLFGVILFALSAVMIHTFLRPDPLVVIGGLRSAPAKSPLRDLGASIKTLARNPQARLAIGAMAVGHAVMVGVMTMTPVHMENGGHELEIVGYVISLHIVGMYFFAPLVGPLVDRLGPLVVMAAGGMILFAGGEIASHNNDTERLTVFLGLFLIGLGWSFGLVAGSSLLTASVPVEERVNAQGVADFVMTGAGMFAGIGSGAIVTIRNYHDLGHWAGIFALSVSAAAIWALFRSPPKVNPAA